MSGRLFRSRPTSHIQAGRRSLVRECLWQSFRTEHLKYLIATSTCLAENPDQKIQVSTRSFDDIPSVPPSFSSSELSSAGMSFNIVIGLSRIWRKLFAMLKRKSENRTSWTAAPSCCCSTYIKGRIQIRSVEAGQGPRRNLNLRNHRSGCVSTGCESPDRKGRLEITGPAEVNLACLRKCSAKTRVIHHDTTRQGNSISLPERFSPAESPLVNIDSRRFTPCHISNRHRQPGHTEVRRVRLPWACTPRNASHCSMPDAELQKWLPYIDSSNFHMSCAEKVRSAGNEFDCHAKLRTLRMYGASSKSFCRILKIQLA